jgi:hypothetical protein
MILGIEIALLVVGILALVRGKLPLDNKRAVYGLPARFLGLVALTPMPLSFLAIMVYTASQISAGDPATVDRFVQDNKFTLILIEAACTIGVAVFVFVFGRLFSEEGRDEQADEFAKLATPVRREDDVDEAVKRWLQNRTKRTDDEAIPLVTPDR